MVNLQDSNNLLEIFYRIPDSTVKESSRVEIYPSPTKIDPSLGQICVFVKLPDKKHLSTLPHLIAAEFKTNYFSAIVNNPEQAFEYAVQKVNLALRANLKDHSDHAWLKDFQAVLLASFIDEVHISFVGSIHPYLCQGYKINKLGDEEEKTPISFTKIFSSIISGTLTRTSSLLVVNGAVLDYVSLERLKKLSLDDEHPFDTSLETLLESARGTLTFFGICLRLGEGVTRIREKTDFESVTHARSPKLHKPASRGAIAKKAVAWTIVYSAKQATSLIQGAYSLSKNMARKDFRVRAWTSSLHATIGRCIQFSLMISKKQWYIRTAVYLVIILLSGFFYSLSFSYYKNQDSKHLNLFETTLQSLVSQKEKAQASLIYNDKATASLLLESIQVSLTTLDAQSDDQIKKKQEFEKELLTISDKINDVHRVTGSTVIYTNTPQYVGVKLLLKDTSLFVVRTDGQFGKQLSGKKISLPAFTLTPNTKDYVLYNDRVYALLPETSTIEARGKKWNTSTDDLTHAIHISVDGFVYTLSTGNKIDKWLKGKKESTISILPSLHANPSLIFTDDATKLLYALDTTQGRIYALDKNGTMIRQIEGDLFTRAIDFVIDEKSHLGYVLTNNDVQSFKLP